MKKHFLNLIVLFVCYSTIGFGHTLTYQGKLTALDGVGVNDTLPIRFVLYESEEGADSVWGEVQPSVQIIKGLFDVELGSINPIDLPFDKIYWLGIFVNGLELSPRVKLTRSPYAIRAMVADSFTSGIAPWTQDTMIAHWDSLRNIPIDIADGDDFEPNTVDTFIAHWDSVRNMPPDFADGVDDIGQRDTMIAHWDSLRNIPADIADGDDFEPNTIDTNIAHWGDIRDIPVDIVDGDDFEPNTVDTFIAHWDSIRNVPPDFADGVDDIGQQDTMIAHWDSIRGVPADIADGDNFEANTIDTNIAHWGDVRDIPADIADGDDFEANTIDTNIAHWGDIRDIPAGIADGDDFEPNTIDTNIAHWGDVRDIPADIADGDDFEANTIDTNIAHWGDIRDIPADIADGDDFEPNTIDTNIAHWGDIRDIPADIVDGDDFDTTIAHWATLRDIPTGFADGIDDTGSNVPDNDWQLIGADIYSIPSGNVGIGTSSPDEKLTVDGNVHITGDLIVDGSGSISGQGKCVYWPEYPNAVFWRGTGVAHKNIRASASYDSTTGQTYYLIEKQDGINVQNYRMIVIWHPPDDYNYANNSTTQFTLNYELGSGETISSVSLKTADRSSTSDIGLASLTTNQATLTDFTGLDEGEWVVIDIAFNVDDGQSIKLYDIQITYDR